MNASTFRVALTGDFFLPDGSPKFADTGLSTFDEYDWIKAVPFERHEPEVQPEQFGDANGMIVMLPKVTAQTVSDAKNLLAIGRFGVGYDNVDVQACTEADVAVFITAGAVDRSVAEATIGWMIALTHHMRAKDQLARAGDWTRQMEFMGSELRDRTYGSVGLGRIAQKTIRMLSVFEMNKPIAFDPFVTETEAADLGIELVELDRLMAEADFVSLHCPLNDATRNLIGERELSLMKPTAFLINTARGGIVNEDALYDVLKQKRIAGAALDCFVEEPQTEPSRFQEFDNVLLAPHSIAWTTELFRDIGRAACQGMIDLAHGVQPKGVINPEVFERPGFVRKWERIRRTTR